MSKEGVTYQFLKTGQRVYWLEGEQPLLEKSEDGKVSPPIASVIVKEFNHFIENGKIWTKGEFLVVKVLDDGEIYFNGCEPISN